MTVRYRKPSTVTTLRIDGVPLEVVPGTTVAAAIAQAGTIGFRRSRSGQLRSPLCGMGVCFECRVTIDGRAHQLACQTSCRDGMEVVTDG